MCESFMDCTFIRALKGRFYAGIRVRVSSLLKSRKETVFQPYIYKEIEQLGPNRDSMSNS